MDPRIGGGNPREASLPRTTSKAGLLPGTYPQGSERTPDKVMTNRIASIHLSLLRDRHGFAARYEGGAPLHVQQEDGARTGDTYPPGQKESCDSKLIGRAVG